MRANNLLLIWLVSWILLSIIGGWPALSYFGWQVVPVESSIIAFLILKLMENRLEAAVFADRLQIEHGLLADKVLPRTLPSTSLIGSLMQYSEVVRFFKLGIYIEDASTLAARIKRDISYYLLGAIITALVVIFSVISGKTHGVPQAELQVDWKTMSVPTISILLAVFRVWLPVQDMATRNEPVIKK